MLAPAALSGAVDVIAEAHQTAAAQRGPHRGTSLPVTPARLRWRVRRGARTVRPWHTPVDLGKTLLPKDAFRRVYAPGTRQNRAGRPGLYRFYLAHTWSTALLEDGIYQLDVEAIDLRGNKGTRQLALHDRQQRLIPTSNPSGEDSSEVECRDHGGVVGAGLAFLCVGVVFDRRHAWCGGDGGDVCGVGAGDEVVADEDVVDQFGSAAVDPREALRFRDEWGEVPDAIAVAGVVLVESVGVDLRAGWSVEIDVVAASASSLMSPVSTTAISRP